VPGALVSDASCQQLVGGGKYRRVMLHGIGDVRVRAYTSGPALKTSPVQLTTRVAGGRARSVVYKLDGRRLRSAHGATHRATITPARLGRIGSHVLVTTLRGRRGKPRAIWLTLRTVRCHTLFTAQRWRTLAGQGLRLRVDARSALRRIRFAVPAALLPRAGAARTIGFIRLYLSGRARPVRRALRFARRGSRMLKAAGWPTVVRTRRGLDVTGLPAGTAVAELTLYRVTRLDGRTTARRLSITARISARTSIVLRRRPAAPR
jgi:hypothetical protein